MKMDEWLSKLNVEQKVNLVVGTGANMPGATDTIIEKVPGAVGNTFAVPE